MVRYGQLFLGIAAYLLFFATFLYLIGFIGNLVVPISVDTGPSAPPLLAATIDIALIALFGVQHSVMARPGFKAGWKRIVPPALERAFYVVAASLVLIVLMAFWQPLPSTIWAVSAPDIASLLWGLFALGWGIVLLSTFLINHFELFGLHQLWRLVRGQAEPEAHFVQPLLYRWVRHPLYLGFLIAFWAIPHMTAGHLLFAAGMTAYILIAIRFEERDLIAAIGAPYRAYRQRVGMLLPGLGRARD